MGPEQIYWCVTLTFYNSALYSSYQPKNELQRLTLVISKQIDIYGKLKTRPIIKPIHEL